VDSLELEINRKKNKELQVVIYKHWPTAICNHACPYKYLCCMSHRSFHFFFLGEGMLQTGLLILHSNQQSFFQGTVTNWRPSHMYNNRGRTLVMNTKAAFNHFTLTIQNRNVNPYFKSPILSLYLVNTGTHCLSWHGDLPRSK
jgi:hypothetical protein